MTKELIAQWVIDNRYGKSENDKVSDSEMYHKLVDEIESLIQNHGDIGDVSDMFIVHDDGRPITYHKTEKGANERAEEWKESGIKTKSEISVTRVELAV